MRYAAAHHTAIGLYIYKSLESYSSEDAIISVKHSVIILFKVFFDALDGQEVLFPVVMPREIWEQSGRYTSIGSEMVRFKDRADRDMLLGMTPLDLASSRNLVCN